MKNLINKILGWFKTEETGLLKHIPDVRDLLWEDYLKIKGIVHSSTPYVSKQTSLILKPFFLKNQQNHDNCWAQGWANSYAVYFGENESACWLSGKANEQGQCNSLGGASNRVGADIGKNFGIISEHNCPSDESLNWPTYINLNFAQLNLVASPSKIGSYYFCQTVDDVLSALDEGYAVTIGRNWLTGMDNLQPPYIINRTGTSRGGHLTLIVGYELNYQGQAVDTELNSWANYGDSGLFHCPLTDLQQDIDDYGAIAITPIPYTPKQIKVKTLSEQLESLKNYLTNFMNAESILYGTAYELIGQDLAVGNEALGCAISLAEVVNKAFQEDNKWQSTTDVYNDLSKNPKYELIDEPEKGAIIVSVSSMIPANSPLEVINGSRHGHCGVLGQFPSPDGSVYIMSNSSDEGKWDTTWTYQHWTDYYKTYGLVPTFMFRRLLV